MNIDYKVGDWVETCRVMPGIVQKIIPSENTVQVYYPDYKEKYPDYNGFSCCSITNCGVHYIDSELAEAFLKVGEERSTRVYNFLQRNVNIYGISKKIKYCEKYYKYDKNWLEELHDKLSDAWSIFDELYHQTIKDLANDVINVRTKGIWLSYQRHTIKRFKNGIMIIEIIPTGEQFLVKKTRRKNCRMQLRTKYQIIKKLK